MNASTHNPTDAAHLPIVMLVDDDTFMHDVVFTALEKTGTCVLKKALNGREALRELGTMDRAPDVLLCDIFMPDMDGIEFLGRLAKVKYSGNIVLMSGVNSSMLGIARDIAAANRLHVVHALQKPVPQLVLQDIVKRLTAPLPTGALTH
jgi:CheY-like chemotaxis protein